MDKEKIQKLYFDMYDAMVNKDYDELERIHDDSFCLVHMTGMIQNKKEYIDNIISGTLNYYSQKNEELIIEVDGNKATMVGKSKVTAAVFGGGKHTWRLQLSFELIKDNNWKIISAKANTY